MPDGVHFDAPAAGPGCFAAAGLVLMASFAGAVDGGAGVGLAHALP
jgi:hypothetical protein